MRSRSKNLLLYRFVVCEFRGVGMNIIEKFIKVLERYMDNQEMTTGNKSFCLHF